jgi:hypothetical protein
MAEKKDAPKRASKAPTKEEALGAEAPMPETPPTPDEMADAPPNLGFSPERTAQENANVHSGVHPQSIDVIEERERLGYDEFGRPMTDEDAAQREKDS